MPKERDIALDVLKIIAMFMVVGLHVQHGGGLAASELLRLQYGIELCAIPLFFMVSGFLMQGKSPNYHYVLRKIGNILRFVLIIVGITCLFTAVFEHHPRIHSLYLWFVQRGTYWQFWYFGAMICIYLLTPVICRLIASKYAKYVLAIFASICCVIFVLNSYFDFERTYICQTFRLWNWGFYFMLGAYIKQYGLPWKVNGMLVLLMAIHCSVLVAYGPISGVEYYHCSIFAMIYTYVVFAYCKGRQWKENRLIKELSNLFLPVYTTHPFVYRVYADVVNINISPEFAYIIRYVTVLIVTLTLSFVIMKIPYINKIFKI